MAKPIVTTAAASMPHAINWQMRLGGAGAHCSHSLAGEFAPERSRGQRGRASGWLTTIAGTESEGTVVSERRGQGSLADLEVRRTDCADGGT